MCGYWYVCGCGVLYVGMRMVGTCGDVSKYADSHNTHSLHSPPNTHKHTNRVGQRRDRGGSSKSRSICLTCTRPHSNLVTTYYSGPLDVALVTPRSIRVDHQSLTGSTKTPTVWPTPLDQFCHEWTPDPQASFGRLSKENKVKKLMWGGFPGGHDGKRLTQAKTGLGSWAKLQAR